MIPAALTPVDLAFLSIEELPLPLTKWEQMAAEVAYTLACDLQTSLRYFDCDNVLIPSDARDDDPTRVDQRKRYLRMFSSERAFVVRVWTAVAAPLAARADAVVVLFDVDQTLGSRKGRDGESATLIRPSAVPLMAQLREVGARMGLLTTRGIRELRRNLEDVLHLQGIAPYLDENHLIAANMEVHADRTVDYPASQLAPDLYEPIRRLLAPPADTLEGLRAYRDERGRPLPAKDVNKLLQLAYLRQCYPYLEFVVVDDRDYAALLRPDGPILGIHLAEHERAHF